MYCARLGVKISAGLCCGGRRCADLRAAGLINVSPKICKQAHRQRCGARGEVWRLQCEITPVVIPEPGIVEVPAPFSVISRGTGDGRLYYLQPPRTGHARCQLQKRPDSTAIEGEKHCGGGFNQLSMWDFSYVPDDKRHRVDATHVFE